MRTYEQVMETRRSFLAAGLALPAVRLAPAAPEAPKTPAVRHRVLGKTGLKVSEVGCSSETVSDVTVVQRAVDLGINFFDTARNYEGGQNERVVAAGLGARRKDVILSTRSYAPDRPKLEADLDASLKELKTDYVDLWFLGAKDKPVGDDMLEFQRAAQKAGKIRFRAFSTHRPWALLPFIKQARFDVVMIPYNFAIGKANDPFKMDGTNIDAFLAELHKEGIGVVAMKTMAGGYKNNPQAPKDTLEDIHKRPRAHVAALRWALRTPYIQTTTVSMRDRDQLEENMEAMAAPFSDGDAKTLTAQLDIIRPVYCRMCYRCEGQCPQGLPVADVLRYLMYADSYGRFDMGYQRFSELAADVRTVRCDDCGQCDVRCPNGVAVRQRLIRAQELFA
jgi:predicted aldo/keto reductase-like oxidoreductase